MCTLSVSNVIYHKFSHGAAFYTLNGKNVNVMLEFIFTGASNTSTGSDDSWELKVTAIHPFQGQIPCDLSFKPGVYSSTNLITFRFHF